MQTKRTYGGKGNFRTPTAAEAAILAEYREREKQQLREKYPDMKNAWWWED